MLSPAAMHKVRIYVMERDARRVARALGKLGVVHLSSSVEDSEGRLQPEAIEEEAARCQDLTERLRALMEQLGVEETPRRLPLPEPAGGLDEVAKLVTTLEASVATQADQLGEAEQALADTEEILHELSPYRHVRGPMQRLAGSTFLEVKAGTADRAGFEAMRAEMPDGVLLMPLADADTGSGPVDVLALSSRRRRFAMETVLGEHGFEEKSVPAWEERTPAEVYDEATARKRELGEKIGSLRARLRAAGEPFAEDLRRASYTLSAQAKLLEAERNFGTTWATAVISGWVPAEKTEELRRVVAQAAEGRAVVETTRPDSEEIMEGRVPSCVDQSPLLSPFQRLAQGYGVASYTDIEPTVMFALTFLLMFGIIFGDLGHGICLLVIGLLTRRWARAAVGRDVGHVIAASGAASMLTGTFLQGSFFGKSLTDMGFPLTLGFEPIRFEGAGAGAAEHVMRYVLLAAALGIALISLGVVLNVVSRLRRGDYEGGLLGRFGLAGIIFYWGALALAVKLAVVGAGAADTWLVVFLIALPLAVVVVHEPLYALLTHRKPIWSENPLMGFFEGLIEALETVMVYLANTFSFLRVAAFALSHAALCFTIFVLQRLVNGLPGGLVWSAAVFVVGTAVIIGLEGLIVAIQIIRLEYYEFFTKFFQGEGTRYKPFRLE